MISVGLARLRVGDTDAIATTTQLGELRLNPRDLRRSLLQCGGGVSQGPGGGVNRSPVDVARLSRRRTGMLSRPTHRARLVVYQCARQLPRHPIEEASPDLGLLHPAVLGELSGPLGRSSRGQCRLLPRLQLGGGRHHGGCRLSFSHGPRVLSTKRQRGRQLVAQIGQLLRSQHYRLFDCSPVLRCLVTSPLEIGHRLGTGGKLTFEIGQRAQPGGGIAQRTLVVPPGTRVGSRRRHLCFSPGELG